MVFDHCLIGTMVVVATNPRVQLALKQAKGVAQWLRSNGLPRHMPDAVPSILSSFV